MPNEHNDERVLRCPSCGQDDGGFAIDAMAPRIVYVDACEDSYDEKDSGDCSYDWGNDSWCRCVKCGHTSKLGEFRVNTEDDPAVGDGFGPIDYAGELRDVVAEFVADIEAAYPEEGSRDPLNDDWPDLMVTYRTARTLLDAISNNPEAQ